MVGPGQCNVNFSENKKMDWTANKSIKWDESQVLGRGCQGTVVFAGHYDSRPCAVKRVLISNVQLIERELNALLACRHPNIVQLYHVEKDSHFLKLALELCAATLGDYCRGAYTGPVPDEIEALRQMLQGVAYLHSLNYVHRDVKPNNILVTDAGCLKISDFGFCKAVSNTDRFSLSDAGKGTDGWMAPEILRSITAAEERQSSTSPLSGAHATAAIDVFPLGCVFYYFLTKGKHPFGSGMFRNSNILTGKHDLSGLAKKHILRGLIKEMISSDPEQRPKLDEILSRPIFNAVTSNELLNDDTKFSIWLKDLKRRFRSQSKQKSAMNPAAKFKPLDECDSNGKLGLPSIHIHPIPHARMTNTWTPSTFAHYQEMAEEDGASDTRPPSGLVMSTSRQKNPHADDVARARALSAPESWRRSPASTGRRGGRVFFCSVYEAEESDTASFSSKSQASLAQWSESETEMGAVSIATKSTISQSMSSLHVSGLAARKSVLAAPMKRSLTGDQLNKSS